MKGWNQKDMMTGNRTESAEPNKFIMTPARGRKNAVKMYAPVKMMTPAQYKWAINNEAKKSPG